MTASTLKPPDSTIPGMTSLSERIETILKVADIKKSALARVGGVTASSVTQWLTGDTKHISPEVAYKIADELRIEARWIMLGEGPMLQPPKDTRRDRLIDRYETADERGRRVIEGVAESVAPLGGGGGGSTPDSVDDRRRA